MLALQLATTILAPENGSFSGAFSGHLPSSILYPRFLSSAPLRLCVKFRHPRSTPRHPQSTVDLGLPKLTRVENGLTTSRWPGGWPSFPPIKMRTPRKSGQKQTVSNQKIIEASPLTQVDASVGVQALACSGRPILARFPAALPTVRP